MDFYDVGYWISISVWAWALSVLCRVNYIEENPIIGCEYIIIINYITDFSTYFPYLESYGIIVVLKGETRKLKVLNVCCGFNIKIKIHIIVFWCIDVSS